MVWVVMMGIILMEMGVVVIVGRRCGIDVGMLVWIHLRFVSMVKI